jgi:hypothetical protein
MLSICSSVHVTRSLDLRDLRDLSGWLDQSNSTNYPLQILLRASIGHHNFTKLVRRRRSLIHQCF